MSEPQAEGEFQRLPHARALAFLGDAVFECFLREIAVQQGKSLSKDLHQFTVRWAKATGQIELLRHIEPLLTEQELEIIRQARNLKVTVARRTDQATHRIATGFEALIGALHLQQPQRLQAIFSLLRPIIQGVAPNPNSLP